MLEGSDDLRRLCLHRYRFPAASHTADNPLAHAYESVSSVVEREQRPAEQETHVATHFGQQLGQRERHIRLQHTLHVLETQMQALIYEVQIGGRQYLESETIRDARLWAMALIYSSRLIIFHVVKQGTKKNASRVKKKIST